MSLLRRRPLLAWTLALLVAVAAAVVVARGVDTAALSRVGDHLLDRPLELVGVLAVYGSAFLLRTVAWRRVLPALRPSQALAAIHVALLGNHVLPLRLGEALRVTSIVRRQGVAPRVAAASTVTLRAADVVAVGVLALATGSAVVRQLLAPWLLAVLAVAAVALLAGGVVWLRRLRDEAAIRMPGAAVAALALAAWVLEAVVVWRAAAWAGVELGALDAVLVTAVTIAAQTAAVAPGGFGTYEAAATAALAALGTDPATALAVALTAHAVKTAYALLVGSVALVVPAPGMLGRLRLPQRPRGSGSAVGGTEPASRARGAAAAAGGAADGPVVLMLPAHDEQDTVGAVVARAPGRVHGRPVEVLVVDDGSGDATAARAAAAGAHVVRHDGNRGLGAAVRTGLAAAVERGASVVAFCDADGEYAPEELEVLTAPILAGEADYVVGSRFGGEIRRMLPHRRFGNRVLTVLLRQVARVPITDGQSGYRALSREAAAGAEIVHDYNYAQVLTLDLLAKGFRYQEVPITYAFRHTGRSFVRLGTYLRAVVPAVWRVLNPPPHHAPSASRAP